MYLPQFHQVKENDEWWEEGYTEWTAVRRARPMFEGHSQPKVPLNNNYYNLLEYDVMHNQAKLMQEYGVDGQCFYHYWFKDGRRILEKPAENLLQWTEIHMPFCFCWANETWARSWSAIRNKNSWNDDYEKNTKDPSDGILLQQEYGMEKDWVEHFYYLLPFFKDKRYLKKDNKPIFLLYKTSQINCLREMITLWDNLAKENGIPGLYIIGGDAANCPKGVLNRKIIYEPSHAMAILRYKENLHAGVLGKYDYGDIWDLILDNGDKISDTIYEGVVGYDDTPRRGHRGSVIIGQTPQKFQKYLTQLLVKTRDIGNDLVFLNAWNEWGEGMYLEPDEKNQYEYLKCIKYAKEHYQESGNKFMNMGSGIQLDSLRQQVNRYEGYWRTLDRWLMLKEQNINFTQYFSAHGIESVAIYGMGMLGKHLYRELEGNIVEVMYGIDCQGQLLSNEIKIYAIEDDLPKVDAVVIALTYGVDDVMKELQIKGCELVLSLSDIIEELERMNGRDLG